MAGTNIPARATIDGVVHRVDPRELAATDTLPARTVADVLVLTDGGGFASVYVPDAKGGCPGQGERVSLTCDISVWNRNRRDGNGTYPQLYIKFAQQNAVPSLAAVPAYDPQAI
jgi:hypothetical protein